MFFFLIKPICLLPFDFFSNKAFQRLWRSVPVDSVDEEKIEQYLKKQGISLMQKAAPRTVVSVLFFANCESSILL